MIKNNNNTCNNCGKHGHLYHQCLSPIISHGIIVFRKNLNGINEYLMICRKNSFGYIDFIRGKYSQYNVEQMQELINGMTNVEKHDLQNQSFDTLCNTMWNRSSTYSQHKNEEIVSQKKYEMIKTGIFINDTFIFRF